jgi:UDP-N-acetylmuramoyl-L-alanyl-D-glutamate--2,6-diaminopimelate ligase
LEAPDLQAAFAAMVEQGIKACVMEVSSHAVAQHRVDGFQFDLVAFTNLSRDHLDYHGGMEKYFDAKAALFTPKHAHKGVIQISDAWGGRLAREAAIPLTRLVPGPIEQCKTTGLVTKAPRTAPRPAQAPPEEPLGAEPADWIYQAGPIERGLERFVLIEPNGRRFAAAVAIPGAHNLGNAALALTSAIVLGADGQAAISAIRQVNDVPGRMQTVGGPEGSPYVVVDYAHAPESVAAALTALRRHTEGRLIVVLGAGGDRDQGKRQPMGAAAAKLADLVVITDDNPRTEDPAAIRAALLTGAGAKAIEVPSRADAIGQAIAGASSADTVAILGKGHETTIDYGGRLLPHQDQALAYSALTQKAGGQL